MTTGAKTKLSLRKPSLLDDEKERTVQLGLYDVLLPCRSFRIEHKSAEVGKVSITAEFLLRLLKSVGAMRETDVAEFFGYDHRELSFVLGEVEAADLVVRADGWLSLTTTGQSVFRPGSDEPEIYEVEQRTGTYGFDLISLAPEQRARLSIFETRLPELPVVDTSRLSSAAAGVRESFRRFYAELVTERRSTRGVQSSLYSIDGIEPKGRFLTVVRLLLTANGAKPSDGEIDLSDWRADFELADREAIGVAAAYFGEALRVDRRSDDPQAYRQLLEFAPEFLKEFTRKDGLAVERYYRDAYGRTGDVRSDRPTVTLLGSFFTPANAKRLMDVAEYGLRKLQHTPETIYWAPPQMPMWGTAGSLPELIDLLKAALRMRNEENGLSVSRPQSVVLNPGKPAPWTEKAFDHCAQTGSLALPGALEIVLVPGVLAAALVHAPVGANSGHAVPLGFASFDARVIERVTSALMAVAPAFGLDELLLRDLASPDDSSEEGSQGNGVANIEN